MITMPLHLENPIIANGGIIEITYRNQLIVNGHITRMKQERVSDERLIKLMKNKSPLKVDVGYVLLDSESPDHKDFLDRYSAMYVYEARHGEDATLPYLGLRKPKTLKEKLTNAITGRLPKI